jgi:uncharacterized protein YdhG (YjbR/CyaY superfamily)
MTVIDDYLAEIPAAQRAELERVRAVVKRIVPDAEEVISYRMPAFKYRRRYLVGMAAFKDHLSVFPGAEPIAVLQDELAGFQLAKGTIQFTLDHPLPESLIEEIVTLCLERITAKTSARY